MRTLKAFRSARLLLSSSEDLILDGLVVVNTDSGKIVEAGSWSAKYDTLSSDKIELEDLGDVTLMPGLFDCHVHLFLDPGGGRHTTEVIHSEVSAQMDLMSSNALKLLDAGVTSTRDLGCPGTLAITLRDEITARKKLGPRLMVANAPITVPGGHACSWGGVASGVQAVRDEARKRIAEGADIIKVMSTGGFMTTGSHPSQARYSVEELIAIREEAHSAGLKVTTHALGIEGIRRAVEAGFDSIEHCSWSNQNGTQFDATIAEEIVKRGIAVCPTMNSACTQECYFCPWDAREMIISNLASLRKAGARMIVGTDAGIRLCHFERYADGLLVLQDAGYTPREIVHSATTGAAYECGLGGITGELKAGMDADLAAFAGYPLEDLTAFGQPTFVMARGQRHQLRPIAPLGDKSAEVDEIMADLRRGAGMEDNR